jgi:hypothetical protein
VRRLALQNLLEAPVHGGIDLRARDAAIGNVKRNLQVAFDAVEGADEEAVLFSRRQNTCCL